MAFNPYPSFGDVFSFDPNTGALKYRNNGSYSTGLLSGGYAAATPNSTGAPHTESTAPNPTSVSSNPAGIDWGAIISGDPAYQQTLADMKAANIGDQASRDAAIRRAIINYGQVPDLAAAQQALGFNLGPIVDAQTRQLAGENQYSTEANLQHNQQLGIQKLRQELAARGALQSGELGYQLGEANRAYGNAQNTATQNLLDALAGYQGQYVNAVNGRQQTATQALLDALTRAIGLYGASAGGSGGGGAAPAPSSGGTASPTGSTSQTPIVGTAVGLPAPNAAALQAGRLARVDYTM